MSKTKRQLRAEAVERLDAMHDEDYIGNGTWTKAITGRWVGIDEAINELIFLLTDEDWIVRNEASDDELFRCSYCHCKVYNIDMTEGDCGWGFTFCPQCGGEVDEHDSRKIEAELGEPTNDLALLRAQAERERDEWKAKAEQSNLKWLYEHDEFFNRFTRWYVTDGTKVGDDIQADEWLMAHVDAPEPFSDAQAEEAHSEPPETETGAQEQRDTREKLEADAVRFVTEAIAQGWEHRDENEADIIALLDRQAAITEREVNECAEKVECDCDCCKWQDERDEMQAEVDGLAADNAVLSGKAQAAEEMLLYLLEGGEPDWEGWLGNHDGLCDYFRERFTATVPQLEHELKRARKYGEVWPSFEDGAPAEFGDEFLWGDGEVYTVDGIKIERGFTGVVGRGHAAHAPLKRPPLKANDGEPIAIGETLYGGDGMAWEVERIDHAGSHPVIGVNRDAATSEVLTRALKPEWLTHEEPDSWERVATELFDVAARGEFDVGEEAAFHERIEKLAKGN